MKKIIIDIREREEYAAEYIEGSINLPLSENESAIIKLIEHSIILNPQSKTIIMCKSGKRSEMLYNILEDKLRKNTEVFNGGIDLYNDKTTNKVKTKLSLFRQVMVSIGLILIGTVLISIGLLREEIQLTTIIPFMIGLGTIYAGLSGNCMMMGALKLMPWNKGE